MPPTSKPSAKAEKRRCPACNAIVIPSRPRCVSCGMEVARMEEFERAKAAALKKGKIPVVERGDEEGARWWSRPWVWAVAAVVLLAVLLFWVYPRAYPKAPAWKAFPGDAQQAVETYITWIGQDDPRGSHRQAYALLDPGRPKPTEGSDLDHYLQYFHDIHRYFVSEHGEDWYKNAKIAPDPKASNLFTVQVDTDVLHVGVKDESPKDVADKGEHHWTITGIQELDPYSAAREHAAQQEGAFGVIRAYGGGNMERPLRGIIGTRGQHAHENAWETKMRLLPLTHDWRAGDMNYVVIQLWTIRKDPTVRARLSEIAADDRYNPDARLRAKQVLDESLPEEDRIAAGLND